MSSAPALDAAPTYPHGRVGAVSNAGNHLFNPALTAGLIARASRPDYRQWLQHITAAAACTRPVRLYGELAGIEGVARHTADMPDGMIYKGCGNRRGTVCPACSKVYQRDAYQVIKAGIVGGKGIPATVAQHPSVFATFTAPSFGPVHTRAIDKHTCVNRKRCDCRPDPCHARRGNPMCEHGRPAFCYARHETGDKRLGTPVCMDCYDYDAHAVWHRFAGELWRRTKIAIDRELAKTCKRLGIARVVVGYSASGRPVTKPAVHSSAGKAAEFQARAAVHFHALLRLDGLDSEDPAAIAAPPAAVTHEHLRAAIQAAGKVSFYSPPHLDAPNGWQITWGSQLDIRPVTLSGDGEVTDGMVAGYLAKYATKSTEVTGHTSARISDDTIDIYTGEAHRVTKDGPAPPPYTHTEHLIAACWRLGRPTRTGRPKSTATAAQLARTLGQRPAWTCEVCGCQSTTSRCLTCYARAQHKASLHTRWLAVLILTGHIEPIGVEDQGDEPEPYAGLRRWAHMLGFGGHFLTKSRRYSVTFRFLRDARIIFRRNETEPPPSTNGIADDDGEETVLVINSLAYAGSGWHTTADALLANTAAAMAREYAQAVREEIEHHIGSHSLGGENR
jgi:hypothetical protein